MDFDVNKLSLNTSQRECVEEMILDRNRVISLQERDILSLKGEINDLKKQLNYSKQKKK